MTILRSSIGGEAEPRRAPHSEQNFASAAFFEPQAEHVTTGEAYVAMAQVANALGSSTPSRQTPLVRGGLPTGTATFPFTDVEGSTRLVEEIGDEA